MKCQSQTTFTIIDETWHLTANYVSQLGPCLSPVCSRYASLLTSHPALSIILGGLFLDYEAELLNGSPERTYYFNVRSFFTAPMTLFMSNKANFLWSPVNLNKFSSFYLKRLLMICRVMFSRLISTMSTRMDITAYSTFSVHSSSKLSNRSLNCS